MVVEFNRKSLSKYLDGLDIVQVKEEKEKDVK